MSKTCAFVILQHSPDNKYKGNRWVAMASPVGRLHHLAEAIQLAESGASMAFAMTALT